MQKQYTAVIQYANPWWIGWVAEVLGVNCQEASREELIQALKEALQEALEWKAIITWE